MSSKKRETVYLRGKVYWAKIFGAPRPNYNEDGREWSFEFEPNENGVKALDEHGLEDRLRDRSDKKGYEGRGKFLILRRNELDHEGNPNEHIRVVDANNAKWPDNKLLGNETVVDVKVQIVDYGRGKQKGIYPVALRVLELVPYENNDFAPLSNDDEYAGSAATPDFERDFGIENEDETPTETSATTTQDDLDDDMPAE